MMNFIVAVLLILFAAFSRLIPHPANFTPIAAIALFSGVYLDKKYFIIIPSAAMLLSDIFLGFHSTMIWVYGSFAIIALLGLWLKSHKNVGYIFGTTLVSSVIFFIVTNFGVWLSGYYGYSFSGFAECYIMAIPFFRNSVAGDLFYVTALFGIYELVLHYIGKESLQESKVKANKKAY
jgi:Family of unknown function (DUF6580)